MQRFTSSTRNCLLQTAHCRSVLGKTSQRLLASSCASKGGSTTAAHTSSAPSKSNAEKSIEELQAELDRINEEIAAYQAQDGKEDSDDEYEYKNPKTGEIGGPRGPEPTRYGDYAYAGRVTDF